MTYAMITPHRLMAALFILFLGIALMVVAQRRSWKPALAIALGVAVVFRAGILVLTWKATPYDLTYDFWSAGIATLHHHDPILTNTRPQGWASLPTYTFPLAVAVWTTYHLHWSWLIAARLPSLLCDLGVVVVVGKLVTASGGSPRKAALRRFQYACNPVAILISSAHGQLEPFCLLIAFAAFVVVLNGGQAITGRRTAVGGVLLGLAVSGQTWPILFGPALLAALPTWKRRIQATVAGGALWILVFVTMPLTVGTPWGKLPYLFQHMIENQPTIGTWGWSGVWVTQHVTAQPVWADPLWLNVAKYGTKLALVAALIAVFWWRRAHPLDLATATVTALIVVTPSFGNQYLQWPVPSGTARPTRLTLPVQIVAGLYAIMFYLPMQMMVSPLWQDVDNIMMIVSLGVCVALLAALPWKRRIWDRSKPPADMLDGSTAGTTVSDRSSDEAVPEPGPVRDDDLPDRVSDGADHTSGPTTFGHTISGHTTSGSTTSGPTTQR